jgi:c-di-GMP-binding flagellar brake protein YcgR
LSKVSLRAHRNLDQRQIQVAVSDWEIRSQAKLVASYSLDLRSRPRIDLLLFQSRRRFWRISAETGPESYDHHAEQEDENAKKGFRDISHGRLRKHALDVRRGGCDVRKRNEPKHKNDDCDND